jgi:hypothetical protein
VRPALGHPLTDPGGLALPPLVTAVLVMLAVAAVARFWPVAGASTPSQDGRFHSWWGTLRTGQVVARGIGIGLLVLAVAAGRLGSPDELANLAPALVIGVAWPLLLLTSAVLGPVWRWLDPWDGAARVFRRERENDPGGPVWWAIAPTLAWVWYLSAFPDTLDPRNVGLALGLYSAVCVGGCFLVGRRAFLSRTEPFGLLLGWTARLPRGELPPWAPPPGAEAVLGALTGGLLFGAIRLSTLWGSLNVDEAALAYSTLGLVVAAAGVGGLLVLVERWARRSAAGGSVPAAILPATVGVALALGLARNRLTTSVQLLPGLLADPFGRGGGPLARGEVLEAEPFGVTGLLAIQVGLVIAGGVAGAIVLARRVEVPARAPGMAALCLVAGTAAAALTAV